MTDAGEVLIADVDARPVISSMSSRLQELRQIDAPANPGPILHELSNHHVLERLEDARIAFRFEHQQFQEYFAARVLKDQLLQLVHGRNGIDDQQFLTKYVNEPKWEESLRMLAEDIGADTTASGDQIMVKAGSKLVKLALIVDSVFAAELARACGGSVWAEVREELGRRLRTLYAQEDGNYKQLALAAMIATGSEDFKDILMPQLTSPNEQLRLALYHTGTQVHPSSLGPNWQVELAKWDEEPRLTFILQLAHDPWFADMVEGLALGDPSPRVKWGAAQVLSWYGFTEKAERLFVAMDKADLRETLRTAHQGEIPPSQWARIVEIYEEMHAEAGDRRERLRILRTLQRFGARNLPERMKAELKDLDANELKPSDDGGVRWAFEALQKSDPKWVSEWLAGKVLDNSTWFNAWRGLITTMPEGERESVFGKMSTEVLDENEKHRILPLLAASADGAFAERVFQRACDLRRELPSRSNPQDLPKWKVFGQLEELLRAMTPQVLLTGIEEILHKDPEPTELNVLMEVLRFDPRRDDDHASLSPDLRHNLRTYLKRGAERGADPHGMNGDTRSYLALLLARVGGPEDMSDIQRMIDADLIRFREAQEAWRKGDRSVNNTGYMFIFLEALTTVDPSGGEAVALELLKVPEYQWVLAQQLPPKARKKQDQFSMGTTTIDFARLWNARAGKPNDFFHEIRRRRYADTFLDVVHVTKAEREAAEDKRPIDHRLKTLGGALAAVDARRSAELILELMELPGQWDGGTRIEALENLLVAGVQLKLDRVLKILEPSMKELQVSGVYNDQNIWLFRRFLCVLAFVEPPEQGIAKIREILSGMQFPQHEMGELVEALGASQCIAAMDLLMELAGADGKGAKAIGEPWIRAVAALGGIRSTEILLSFVDPGAKIFSEEFIPDYQEGNVLARLLAERAEAEPELKAHLFRLANTDLPIAQRTLLAKVLAHFKTKEDLVARLSVLRDDAFRLPYELVRSMEEGFLERQPYGNTSNTFTFEPREANAVRRRLLEMAMTEPDRKRSALAWLAHIEVSRLERGRPLDEPRHPALEIGLDWPPVLSSK